MDERVEMLRDAGFEVLRGPMDGRLLVGDIHDELHAVVIDLSRLPSHGRSVAAVLREQKRSWNLPIVFVDGEPEKVARAREQIPNVAFAQWRGVKGAIKAAQKQRKVAAPAVLRTPGGGPSGYSGTPLLKKLGVREGSIMMLLSPPANFDATLGKLPAGASIRKYGKGDADLIMVFVRSLADLRRGIAKLAERDDKSPAWIAWPKKTSALAGDVTEREVRALGLAAGMVDYKICAIDADWSGLLFSRKKAGDRT